MVVKGYLRLGRPMAAGAKSKNKEFRLAPGEVTIGRCCVRNNNAIAQAHGFGQLRLF